MRIKISTKYIKNINIQNMKYMYREGVKPLVYFDCPKKYEDDFDKTEVIFHDKKGKEFFRSKMTRLDYLYYEEELKTPKVRFIARDLEIEDFGAISSRYLCKILKKACNAKIIGLPEPIPKIPEIQRKRKRHRSYYMFFAMLGKCTKYLMYVKFYAKHIIFIAKIAKIFYVPKQIKSTAPT